MQVQTPGGSSRARIVAWSCFVIGTIGFVSGTIAIINGV